MGAEGTREPLIIQPSGPLDLEVAAPPSKSITIRAMAAAALADGRSALRQALFSDDTYRMASAMGELGLAVARHGSSAMVEGRGGRLPASSASLDLGHAGTPLRLLTAICCLGEGRYRIDGSERMRQRPIGHLVEALVSLGVRARCVHDDGCPPVEIESRGFPGGRVRLRGDLSSQYLSALLMVAPYGSTDLTIEMEGDLVSRPYVDLTLDVMMAFGAEARREGDRRYHVTAGVPYRARVYPIEADASSASYLFAAPAIAGGRIRVTGISSRSRQGDLGLLGLMERMGCTVLRGIDAIEVRRDPDRAGPLLAVDADLSDMPDMVPTLAALALLADGPTRMTGVAHLRLKESDRIEGIASCVRALGGEARPGPDSLLVIPPNGGPGALHGADIDPREDHRLAMAFALVGLVVPGVRILDPDCVDKSFPDFFERLPLLATRT